MTRGIPKQAPTHYQPCVYDIDGDGNLEMLMADPHDTTSDDLVQQLTNTHGIKRRRLEVYYIHLYIFRNNYSLGEGEVLS